VTGIAKYALPVAPYIGIGLGRATPLHRIGLSADIGTYYRGTPAVDIEGTYLLSNNSLNEAALNDQLKSQVFYPNVSVRLAIRLN
jgi:hypothetical protein